MMGGTHDRTAPVKTTIALVLSLATAPGLHAQRLGDAVAGYAEMPTAPTAPPPDVVRLRPPPSTSAMVATGVLFAAGGIMAGAVAGQSLERCQPGDEFCGLGGAVLGALVGEVLMLPLGVHVSSDRSSLAAKVRASWAVMLAGFITAAPTGGGSLLLVPPAQLWATIAVEKRAIRRAESAGATKP